MTRIIADTPRSIRIDLTAVIGAACLTALPTIATAQYFNDFEDLQGSTAGIVLTNQAGFEQPTQTPFHVYAYAGNTLGLVQNPSGGSKFIAGIGPGPDVTVAASANGPMAFDEGIWEISYDVAAALSGATAPGLEAMGFFQLRNRAAGTDSTAFFRNWIKWSDVQAPSPIDVGYFGFNENGRIFGFYGDNPGRDWSRLRNNHWYRVSNTVDFATNQVLELRITDLHNGRVTTFMPPGNVFLFNGQPHGQAATCTNRTDEPSAPGDCYLLPDSFDMRVLNEHVGGGRNVLAFDNVRIRRATHPADRGYVHDNGPSRGSGKSAIGHMIAADDFNVEDATTVRRVSVDVSDGSAAENRRWDGAIEWWLFDDDTGRPGNVVASGRGLNPVVSRLSEDTFGQREFSVDFDLDNAVDVQAGQTYWLGLHMSEDYNQVNVFWDYTDPFAAEDEGGDVIPTNRTNRAHSGGTLENGVPVFPVVTGSPPRRELAFRIVPQQWCRTILGRTFCLSRLWQRVAQIMLAAVVLFSAAALARYQPWKKRRPTIPGPD